MVNTPFCARFFSLLCVAAALLVGCSAGDAASRKVVIGDGETESETGADTDPRATDENGDTDSSAQGEGEGEGEEILPDCSSCPGVGTEMENLRCAIDLCDDSVFISQTYSSPTVSKDLKLTGSRAAVERFGDPSNDLIPLYPEVNGSYALMATGKAVPSSPVKDHDHNQSISSAGLSTSGPGIKDPFAPYDEKAYDVVEWRLQLRAPEDAHGFRIHYVFFSVEYDEYVGREFNDKFYIILEAQSTNGGEKTVINYTDCRPTAKPDFICPAGHSVCDEGDEYCYIAINSALSECCWYDGCTTSAQNTDIGGTGFECGTEDVDYVGDYSMGFTYGSSTGWLATEWPIEPGEEFAVTFHIHDTADSILDSEVLLDKFVFVKSAEAGTVPVVK